MPSPSLSAQSLITKSNVEVSAHWELEVIYWTVWGYPLELNKANTSELDNDLL